MEQKLRKALDLVGILAAFWKSGYEQEVATFLYMSQSDSQNSSEGAIRLALDCGSNAVSKVFLALSDIAPFPSGNYTGMPLPIESYNEDAYPLVGQKGDWSDLEMKEGGSSIFPYACIYPGCRTI